MQQYQTVELWTQLQEKNGTMYVSSLSFDEKTDDTTLYSKCDQASNLWQQLKLASELESDLQDTGLG